MRRLPALLVVSSLIVSTFALGCSREAPSPTETNTAKQESLPDRDPALARKLVAEGAPLLDVRTAAEFDTRHLDKAVNIPVGDLSTRMAEVEKLVGGDKTKPIVVYCGSGRRSAQAKSTLTAAGYTKVTNLGGIDDWDKK